MKYKIVVSKLEKVKSFKSKKYLNISLAIAFFFLNSCSSVIFTSIFIIDKKTGYEIVYAGTKYNYYVIFAEHHPHNIFAGPTFALVSLIDFPLSFVFDTALLPITIPYAIISDIFQNNDAKQSFQK